MPQVKAAGSDDSLHPAIQVGRIVQINLSDGGLPKLPVEQAEVTANGLVGDRQKNLKYHGGPDRAVCLWSAEIIAQLQREGHPIAPGSSGENLTIEGLDWAAISIGSQLRMGDSILIEITDYAQPCRTIAKYFMGRKYGRISQKRNPGQSRLYARVLQPGKLRRGDHLQLLR
ncbi:MAG: MOSC domain-containing protein [Leptolyngbya sp. RL_3_1]|nr:MOSC domain-containing protein [Leptolyngbya sp. RL_3_1]